MNIYDRTKLISKQRGLSLQEVAEKAKIGKNSIYHWKNQNPSIANVNKVASVLNVSSDYLLGNTNSSDKSVKQELDLKEAMSDHRTLMSWKGKRIPSEELEMIRRILDGGNDD